MNQPANPVHDCPRCNTRTYAAGPPPAACPFCQHPFRLDPAPTPATPAEPPAAHLGEAYRCDRPCYPPDDGDIVKVTPNGDVSRGSQFLRFWR